MFCCVISVVLSNFISQSSKSDMVLPSNTGRWAIYPSMVHSALGIARHLSNYEKTVLLPAVDVIVSR